MIIQVGATVVDGGLQLDQPVDLPNHSRVTITIAPAAAAEIDPPTDAERRAAWERLKTWIDTHPVHGGGQKFNRDELYDRH